MNDFLQFITLADPNVRIVVIGIAFIAVSTSVVGSFTLLRGQSLVGDAVAHSLLPGVCLGFMISGEKDPWWLLAGGLLSGWLAAMAIDWLSSIRRIRSDAAIAMVLTIFYGIGVVLLVHIQHGGNASQAGLDHFLFGKAASMVQQDINVFATLAVVVIFFILLLYRPLTLIAFDKEYARSVGVPVRLIDPLFTTLMVASVAIAIQTIGVVLVAAMLIAPAAAARLWTHRLSRLILLAIVFGVLSSWMGSWVSYLKPQMPTGPWIVIFLSAFVFVSLTFAPDKGWLPRWVRNRRNTSRMNMENLLKTLYILHESGNSEPSEKEIVTLREFDGRDLDRNLRALKRKGLVSEGPHGWKLSREGVAKGKRILRLHRAWELYLTSRMGMSEDHIHYTAEAMEHVITPEIEQQLLEELGYPEHDPHNKNIPY